MNVSSAKSNTDILDGQAFIILPLGYNNNVFEVGGGPFCHLSSYHTICFRT